MSYSEDTTDLDRRGIMVKPESGPDGIATDMTPAKPRFDPIQEVGP